jgi:hypothetical protein
LLIDLSLKEIIFISLLAVVKSLASILNLIYKDKNIRRYRYFIVYLENYFRKYFFLTNNSAKIKKKKFYLGTTFFSIRITCEGIIIYNILE